MTPLVSVVTGVYNGGGYLEPSISSVLAQTGVDLEYVVVDDGSTDGSGDVLARLARRDRRLRVVSQPNAGLTRALVRGCAEARGTYIARHDADDLSLPGRLAAQVRLLESDSSLALAASWVYCVGPAGELLLEIRRAEEAGIATLDLLESFSGPVHGSVMFRAADYVAAGGYRPEFRVAQDWDLWFRLLDRGRCAFVPEFLYAHRIQVASISALRKAEQTRARAIAHRCRTLRARNESEDASLAELASPARGAPQGSRAAAAYFIGKCLVDRRDRRALGYLHRSLREDPYKLRTWAAHALAICVCRRDGPSIGAAG